MAAGTPSIPGFEYLSVLGTGGFSDVLLYQQKLPRRRVAVKVLHVDQLDRQARRQFVAEANLMAQLSSHPAIATIYAADITKDGQPYLVMEYCSGGSLGATYRAQPLSVPEVLRVGVRLASALEAAHRLGIVHRDVKPANILLTDYGVPVLTDFGISVGDDGVAEASMFADQFTATATSVGSGSTHGMSVPWAPPEAFEDEPVGDERSDVYSLGATLFSLLEGRTPFEIPGGKNGPVQLSRRIERGELTPSTREDVPEALRAAIAKSMSVARDARHVSALAFAEDLQAVQRSLGEQVTPIELPVTSATGSVSLVAATPGPAEESEQTRVRTGGILPPVPVEAATAAADAPAAGAPAAASASSAPSSPTANPVPPIEPAPAVAGPAAGAAPVAPTPPPLLPQATGPVPGYTQPIAAPAPAKSGGGRVALLATVTALVVVLIGGGVAWGVAALIGNAQNSSTTTSRDRDRSSRDDEDKTDEPEPDKTPVEGEVALCDTETVDYIAEIWEVDPADVLPYDAAPDNPLLDAGVVPACGYFVTDSPAFESVSLQEGFFDGSEGMIESIITGYTDGGWECTGPDEYTTFTAYDCSSDTGSVSIYHYKPDYTFGAPEVLADSETYITTSTYVYAD